MPEDQKEIFRKQQQEEQRRYQEEMQVFRARHAAEGPEGGTGPADRRDDSEKEPWTCQHCTLRNQASNDTCEACEADRPIRAPRGARKRLRTEENEGEDAVFERVLAKVAAPTRNSSTKITI